jgi:RNA polymerase sigma factor (TIGR02999 family)
MNDSTTEITNLLLKTTQGDRAAESELVGALFNELRRVAGYYMRLERSDHTLQPTALVHEVYLRLAQSAGMNWESRSHFFGVAARLMRQVLVDHARSRIAEKRGSGRNKISLDDAFFYSPEKSADVVALDDALSRLAKKDPRLGKVVELRFFTGLTFDEIARILGVSEKTAKRDWSVARAWLHGELSK